MDLDGAAWLRLLADEWSCCVSLHTLRRYPDSLLAGLAETAAAHGQDLRLDLSPDVAREVVAVLRLGDGFVPPDDARLVAALQHALDFLGIPQPARLPPRTALTQPYLFVHSYSCESVDEGGHDGGLLLFSTEGGWCCLDRDNGDPRPASMDPAWYYACATLPAADTGVGQDLMLVAGPERCSSYLMEADTRTVHPVASCRGPTGPCVAVNGRALVLGRHGNAAVQVYDPVLQCWFTAAPMPGGMYDFAAVSPPHSSVVLTFGGVDSATGRHRQAIDLYDTRTRRWVPAPSGAVLPRASRGLAAAPLDEHRVLVFGGSGGRAAHVLELRTWRLLPAGQLSQERQHLAGVGHGGSVMALGGVGEHEEYVNAIEVYDDASASWSLAGHLPFAMSHMAVAAANVATSGLRDRLDAARRRSSGAGGASSGGGGGASSLLTP